jgi:hypothetical protein
MNAQDVQCIALCAGMQLNVMSVLRDIILTVAPMNVKRVQHIVHFASMQQNAMSVHRDTI